MSAAVEFTGYVDEPTKAKLLAQSWVSIQPSSFEGWGITVIESNAAGTPVVAAKIGGLADSVADNYTGLLIEEKNVKAFAFAMEKLIHHHQFREILSENARILSKNYSWDKCADIFLDVVYEHVYQKEKLVQIAKFAYVKREIK